MAEDHKQLQGIAVGGHGGSALLQTSDGKLKKRVNRAPEVNFYKSLKDRNLGDGIKFIPTFYGVEEIDGASWIVIEDLTFNKAKPCILDIKMGTQSFGEDAKEEKKAGMIAKDNQTTTVVLGQRITGFRTWKIPKGEYLKLGKDVTKTISPDTYLHNLREFFDNGEGVRKDVVGIYLEELKKFLTWQEHQSSIRVYSSSLLFVYDAQNKAPNGSVKWIDFAHVFDIKDGGHDEGFLVGLRKLVHYFEELLK